jgi:hypothetical protein
MYHEIKFNFRKDPLMNRMILSVQLDDKLITKTNMTYLTHGLRWTPRYELNILNEQCKCSNLSIKTFGIFLF